MIHILFFAVPAVDKVGEGFASSTGVGAGVTTGALVRTSVPNR
jgi:hypothetical protein